MPRSTEVARAVVPSALWVLSAAVLLVAGFLTWVFIGYSVTATRADADTIRTLQTGFVLYARLVILKGLLPQLLLALVIWSALCRAASLDARGRVGVAVGLVASAALAAAAVVPTLMTSDLLGLPPVKFKDTWNFVQTCLEMTAGVSAVLLATRPLFHRLRASTA